MGKKNRILIIDDIVDTVILLEKIFAAEGYETCAAYDGEEGLNMVKEYRPDLIILDVMMPKLDGFQVLERLRMDEEHKYIPILMLTAKSRLPEKIKGLERGADDYLTKPFDYKELTARVKSLLAKEEVSKKKVEEEKSEALDHMVDEVAHEVRNPLVMIGGFARRVYNNLPPGSRNREYVEIILKNVAALEKMVSQLFELKSAALSYSELSDLNEIINTALVKFDRQFKANQIETQVSLTEPAPFVHVDKENVTKAFECLIENAVEAMVGEIKLLQISTSESDGFVKITVKDTGKGISRSVIKSIYDPFFTSKINGPGLGLTFVLKTIQNVKGTISVESKEGSGTKFIISLPVKNHPTGTLT